MLEARRVVVVWEEPVRCLRDDRLYSRALERLRRLLLHSELHELP